VAYRFRCSVHYDQGGSMAVSRQSWFRQSTEFSIFIWRLLSEYWFPAVRMRIVKSTHTVTYLLQQSHTFSHRAASSKSATLWAKNIQTIIATNEFIRRHLAVPNSHILIKENVELSYHDAGRWYSALKMYSSTSSSYKPWDLQYWPAWKMYWWI